MTGTGTKSGLLAMMAPRIRMMPPPPLPSASKATFTSPVAAPTSAPWIGRQSNTRRSEAGFAWADTLLLGLMGRQTAAKGGAHLLDAGDGWRWGAGRLFTTTAGRTSATACLIWLN